MNRGRIRVGTSGWHYDHWRGPFFPGDLPKERWLEFYAEKFDTVEINNSFYSLPERKTFESWKSAAGSGFVFSVKASRYITHMKKLKDPDEPVGKFMERARALGGSLGPVLFQLPPSWKVNAERLEEFIGHLPGRRRYTFEFRDRTWFGGSVYRILEEAGAAFCIYDIGGETSPKKVTADFVYVRLHGPSEAYKGSYSAQALAGWAGAASSWAAKGLDVFCYFDNDEAGYAADNAGRLRDMVESG